MPVAKIDYSKISNSQQSPSPLIYSTSLGNTLIEIQGTLVTPEGTPSNIPQEGFDQDSKYLQYNTTTDNTELALKIGRLEINELEKKAVLYIGTSQRLLGSIKKVDPPLGLMRFGSVGSNDSEVNMENQTQKVEIVDVIKWKIIFTGRPLPIM